MLLQQIAEEAFRELGSPSTLSVPAVAFWLRNQIGSLNNLIRTSFVVSSDSINVTPEMTDNEKVILKKLLTVYYYDQKVIENLGAAGIDTVLEVSSDGGTVRTASRNEISKSWLTFRRAAQEDLDKLVAGYKANKVSPLQYIPGGYPVSGVC